MNKQIISWLIWVLKVKRQLNSMRFHEKFHFSSKWNDLPHTTITMVHLRWLLCVTQRLILAPVLPHRTDHPGKEGNLNKTKTDGMTFCSASRANSCQLILCLSSCWVQIWLCEVLEEQKNITKQFNCLTGQQWFNFLNVCTQNSL